MTPLFYGKLHVVQLCYCYIAAKRHWIKLLPRIIGSKHNPIKVKAHTMKNLTGNLTLSGAYWIKTDSGLLTSLQNSLENFIPSISVH